MAAQRPEESKIPEAVRAIFSTNRMQGAWNMLSCAGSGDRQAAIEAVSRILEKEGLKIEDIMTTILAASAPATNPMEATFAGFGDIFSGMRRNVPANGGTPTGNRPIDPMPEDRRPMGATHRARPTRILQGSEIPARIYGRVEISDERPTRTGKMLVITVVTQDAVCAPIVAFNDATIARLRKAAESNEIISMRVEPPKNATQMPLARDVR